MLQVEQMMDAAIAADFSLLITFIHVPYGTSHTESSDSTTELLQNAIPVLTIKLYLKHTTCTAAIGVCRFHPLLT